MIRSSMTEKKLKEVKKALDVDDMVIITIFIQRDLSICTGISVSNLILIRT